MRVAIEALHIVAGLIAAVVIAELSAWSYPRATRDIWVVAWVAMVVVVAMGIRPMIRAWRIDRARKEGTSR